MGDLTATRMLKSPSERSEAERDGTTLAPLKFERTSPGAHPQSSGLTAT